MNRKKSTLFVLFFLAIFVLLFSGPGVYADPDKNPHGTGESYGGSMGMKHPPMGPGGGKMSTYGFPGSMTSYLKERLNLDDKQFEQLHKVYSDYEKEMVRRHADIRVGEMELGDLLEAKKLDMNAVEKAVKKVESLRSDLSLYRVKALLRTQEFLTADQFDKFRSYTLGQMRYGSSHGPGYGGYGKGMPPGHGNRMPEMIPGHKQMTPGMMPGYGPGYGDDNYDYDEEDKEPGKEDKKMTP